MSFIQNNAKILTNSDLEQIAPSVFATEAHKRTSHIYKQVPTIQVIDTLRDAGFEPVRAGQARIRDDQTRQGFQKHFVSLRQVGDTSKDFLVGDSVAELLLINAHDGSSSYQFRFGVYRFVCANGMVVSDSEFETLRLRHVGFDLNEVIDASTKITKKVPAIAATIRGFQEITLTEQEMGAFASQALAARYPEDAPVAAHQLLRARRFDDRGADLWSVTNRVQENLIRGGLRGRGSTGRRMTTRQVSSIDANVSVNQKIWEIADKFKALKAA